MIHFIGSDIFWYIIAAILGFSIIIAFIADLVMQFNDKKYRIASDIALKRLERDKELK